MTVFFAILLTVSAFIFIAYPLLRKSGVSTDLYYEDRLTGPSTRRETSSSMLKELESDFHSGVLSEEDYRELEKSYRQEATSISEDTGKIEKGSDTGEEIEKQVAALRRGKGRFCSQCGAGHLGIDRFCPKCGAKLR